MKIAMIASVLAAALVTACTGSARNASDTSAASSTQPAVMGGPSDSVSPTASTTSTGAASTVKKGSGSSKAGSPAKSQSTGRASDRTGAATDPGIIGRDSVIRFPIRGLPTVSSTPIRK
jgi:hypothetical protein